MKFMAKSLRSAFKKKNIVEEGGGSSLKVKREHESTNVRAQKMMRGKLEPFEVPIVVHVAKQIVEILQMTSPQERQLREQKQEVLKMTFPQKKRLRE
jgi:type II secretory pathway component PulL